MKILAISDTHGFHEQLKIPEDIDVIIHGGDFSNYRDVARNTNECSLFLNWYESLNIAHKIVIAGNHDTAIQAKAINPRDFKSLTYLEHEHHTINNIKFFGSPYTPSFGIGWAFNKDRSKLQAYWNEIEDDTDVIITHGPPQGFLDVSLNMEGHYDMCGCKALKNRIQLVKPKYSIFGHIHNYRECVNQGIRVHDNITYMNVSSVEDGKFDRGLISQGIVFEI